MCRDILTNYCPDYKQNQQLVYMICETYLREGNHHQILDLVN